MKKLIVLILALIVVVGIVVFACTKKPTENTDGVLDGGTDIEVDAEIEVPTAETTAPFVPSPEADFDKNKVFPDEETKPSNDEDNESNDLEDIFSSNDENEPSSEDIEDAFKNYSEQQSKDKTEGTESESAE